MLSLMAVSVSGVLLFSQSEARADDLEILTRGPVHEAFAESVNYEPQPGVLIGTQVPEMIDELPPEQRPEGDNVAWIPGYWAWDDEQSDFLWISGIWRDLPPGRQWMPGYWDDMDDRQYQWTSGYWAGEQSNDLTYISAAPPRSIEAGPNVLRSSDNDHWIPGNWMWSDTRYMWRPGQWLPQRENWTWVPSRYVWTRRGYVYVDGYWDHSVARRGVLFAPVHFQGNSYAGRRYTPDIVIGLSALVEHLFVRPRTSHYYFGDYHAPDYRDSGYYPSDAWHSGRGGYDPIYAYQRWEHRTDKNWEKDWAKRHDYYRDHSDARPPRTWALMKKSKEPDGHDFDRHFATPLSVYAEAADRGRNFKKLDKKHRDEIVVQSSGMREFRDERLKLERAVPSKAKDPKKGSVAHGKLKQSPIRRRNVEDLAAKDAPPKSPGRSTSQMRADREKPEKGKSKEGKVKTDPAPKRKDMKPVEKKPKGNPAPKQKESSEKKAKPAESTNKKPKAIPQPKPATPSKARKAPKTENQPKAREPKPSKTPAGPKTKDTGKTKAPQQQSKRVEPAKPTKDSKGKTEAPAKRESKPEKRKGKEK